MEAPPANPAGGASVLREDGGFNGEWRYVLKLKWNYHKKNLVFVLMNPAGARTAHELRANPTVRRCCDVANRAGYGGVTILNLFCWRSAAPDFLGGGQAEELQYVGQEADAYLKGYCGGQDVVCGWGSSAPDWRAKEACWILQEAGARAFCLGQTRKGKPLHPIANGAGKTLLPYNQMFKIKAKG